MQCEDPTSMLRDIDQQAADRVDALLRTSRRGCSFLKMMALEFEAARALVNAEKQSDRAYLDDPRLMSRAVAYDCMNSDDNRVPLVYIMTVRAVLQARIAESAEDAKQD